MGWQISCRLTCSSILLLLFSLVIIPIKLHVVLANDDLFELRQHRERSIKQGSMGVDGITRDNIDRYRNPNMDDRSVKYDPMRRHRPMGKTQGDHKASLYNTSNASLSTTWLTETVDGPKHFSNFYSRAIAVDADGYPHIAYGEDRLYYAYYDGSNWRYETVDSSSGVGGYASIAIDLSGKVHISYFDSLNGNLKYATNASGSWVTTTVDKNYFLDGSFTSIAVDKSGNVHISYYDTIYGDLKYATNTSGKWVMVTVDSSGNVGFYTSIALDKSGKIHISYYDETNADLRYATNASGSWVTKTVDSDEDVGEHTSLVVDISNNVHISYHDHTNGCLKYAHFDGFSWVTTTVDCDGWRSERGAYTSIAIDKAGKVHISYTTRFSDANLLYATNVSRFVGNNGCR